MRCGLNSTDRDVPATTRDTGGLVSWVLGVLGEWRGERVSQRRQLKLVETLALGGKRQLMLVTCGGQSFLLGCGPESVETIVRLNDEALADAAKIPGSHADDSMVDAFCGSYGLSAVASAAAPRPDCEGGESRGRSDIRFVLG